MKLINLLTKIFCVFIFLSSASLVMADASNGKTIKLAIIDNFHFQPNINNQFDSFYKPGIELARLEAKEKLGYNIE